METKLLSLVADLEEIRALKLLIEKPGHENETGIQLAQAIPLILRLEAAYEDTNTDADRKKVKTKKDELESLKLLVEQQKWQISGLMMKAQFARPLKKLENARYMVAAASRQIDPDPLLLKASRDGSSEEFNIRPRNILAIKSDRKIKIVYLGEPVTPSRGGTKRSYIEIRSGFEELLAKLNETFPIFFRLSDGFAINVFEYENSDTDSFVLKNPPKDKIYKPILKIRTDYKFKSEHYKKIMREKLEAEEIIDRYQRAASQSEVLADLADGFSRYERNPSE